jgi:hypothetical protein
MHLAPGRSAWCLAQSNTNSGHGIPSESLTASEHGCRSQQQPGMLSKSPTLDSGKLGADRVCLVRLLPGSWGLSYAEIVGALGAYTASDTRFTHS